MEKRKIRVLDIVIDEKFIDSYIVSNKLLEDIEEHEYIIVKNNDFKYKFIKNPKVKIISHDKIGQFLDNYDCDAIFLHSLSALPLRFFYKYKFKTKLFWFSWGFDIYQLPASRPLIPLRLYHNETRKVLRDIDKSKHSILTRNFNLTFIIEKIIHQLYKKVLSKIDYHSGVLSYESNLIKSKYKNFKAAQVQFNYTDINNIPTYNIPKGNNILVGNSPAPTNNHLDLIPYLKKIDTSNRKIIVPLNYGGDKDYIEIITKEYKKNFGESFIPLLEFMPANKYFEIINSCSDAVFMLERQQAIGNISYCFCRGMKVYLSETSPMYEYYKNEKYRVYSIQKEFNQQNVQTSLKLEEMERNYTLIKSSYKMWEENRRRISEIIRKDII